MKIVASSNSLRFESAGLLKNINYFTSTYWHMGLNGWYYFIEVSISLKALYSKGTHTIFPGIHFTSFDTCLNRVLLWYQCLLHVNKYMYMYVCLHIIFLIKVLKYLSVFLKHHTFNTLILFLWTHHSSLGEPIAARLINCKGT